MRRTFLASEIISSDEEANAQTVEGAAAMKPGDCDRRRKLEGVHPTSRAAVYNIRSVGPPMRRFFPRFHSYLASPVSTNKPISPVRSLPHGSPVFPARRPVTPIYGRAGSAAIGAAHRRRALHSRTVFLLRRV